MSNEDLGPFTELWIRHISELAETIQQIERPSALEFAAMMKFAFDHYGLDKQKLQKDLQIARSTICKWCSGQATPTAPTRKAVREWVLDEIQNITQ